MHGGGDTRVSRAPWAAIWAPPAGGSVRSDSAAVLFAAVWSSCWDLIVHLEELPRITAGIKEWECVSVSQADV